MSEEESLISAEADTAETAAADEVSPESTDAQEHPEWFKSDKYKTIEDQAKAYNDLEGKFGAFTGAPEEYELTLPEGIDGEFDLEDPMLTGFMEIAKEANMNQGVFTQMLHQYVGNLVGMRPDAEAEMKALGDDAQGRLKALGDWGRANLDADQFEAFRNVATTADGVRVLEALVGHTREAKMPREDAASTSSTTADELKAMRYAKDSSGNIRIATDPAYRKKVDKAYADFYGTEPLNRVVG